MWGLIYLTLLIMVIYLCFPRNAHAGGLVETIGFAFIFSAICNGESSRSDCSCIVRCDACVSGLWLIVFEYEILWLSVIIIVFMTASIIVIYRRLRPRCHHCAPSAAPSAADSSSPAAALMPENNPPRCRWYSSIFDGGWSTADYWCVHFPISLYLGWLTVATVSNVALWFYALGWREGGMGWSVLMQAVATGLALRVLRRSLDAAYAAIVSWALFAIASKNYQEPNIFGPSIAMASLVAVLSLCTLLIRIYLWFKPEAVNRFCRHSCSAAAGSSST